MGDGVLLLAVVALLYVTESGFLLHRHAVAFRRVARRACRIEPASANAGGRDRALHLFNLLPPLRPVFLASLLPVSVSDAEVLSFVSQTFGRAGRPGQAGGRRSWDDIRSLERRGAALLVDGAPFARCRSELQAALLAGILERIRRAGTGEARTRALREAIAEALDAEAAAGAVRDFDRRSRVLRAACNGLFALLFIAFPLLIHVAGLRAALPALAAPVVLVTAGVSVSFYRLHRSCFPAEAGERIGAVIRFVVCPPAAIRAADLVSRELLHPFHPVAAAFALCDREGAAAFAGAVLRDLAFPVRTGNEPDGAESVDRSFRAALVAAVEEAARRQGVGRSEWEALPGPGQQGEVAAYCPRCRAPFSALPEACPDCPGVRPERAASWSPVGAAAGRPISRAAPSAKA